MLTVHHLNDSRSQRLVDGPDEVHRWKVGRNVIKAFREHGTTASAAGGDLIWVRWQQIFSENPKKRLDTPVNKLPDGQITMRAQADRG